MRIASLMYRRSGSLAAAIFAAMIAGVVAAASPPTAALAQATQGPSSKLWDGLKPDVFGDRPIQVDTGVIAVTAPKRAEDAALVPVDIQIDPAKSGGTIKSVTLIIDANPAPVAATFEFGKDAGVTHLSTRVRVNDYSFVRAIAETETGELHMAQTYVKASGGCSAPAMKNQDEAKAAMGKMKLKQFPGQAGAAMSEARELQLMIRHPNNSGLQMDQLTRYFIPPHFVHDLTISQDNALILKMEGGISISEDPNFRFDFKSNGAREVEVEAIDTDGLVFRDKWPVEAAGL